MPEGEVLTTIQSQISIWDYLTMKHPIIIYNLYLNRYRTSHLEPVHQLSLERQDLKAKVNL